MRFENDQNAWIGSENIIALTFEIEQYTYNDVCDLLFESMPFCDGTYFIGITSSLATNGLAAAFKVPLVADGWAVPGL